MDAFLKGPLQFRNQNYLSFLRDYIIPVHNATGKGSRSLINTNESKRMTLLSI